ncbi:MAG: ferritin-like domain-containing protein [Nitrososphaeraceae archaeon]
MPKFLDVHPLKGFEEETLRKLQTSPVDEFGIKHVNIMYNQEEDRFYCLLDALKTQVTGELTHAELLSNRISELGDKAPSDPAIWKTQGNIGILDPVQYLTLRAALEKGLEFEGKAVENYNSIAKKALEYNDFVTYNLATQILADELKDEQHTEDVLKNLEVK